MAEQTLVETAPTEDAGSETAARYRYQTEVALHDCLVTLVDGSVDRVICELHEDYIVLRADDHPRLVSVKHLESTTRPWTVRKLCSDGGIVHLFTRWRFAREEATCILRTNAGMQTGKDNPGGLRDCCSRGDEAELAEWAERLLAPFNDVLEDAAGTTTAELCRFLKVLRINDQLPDRDNIRPNNLVNLMPDVLRHLGLPSGCEAEVYDRVASEIERASRNESDRPMLEVIADAGRFDHTSVVAQLIAAKTITKARLLAAVARQPESHATSLRLRPEPAPPQRLPVKLDRGGFGPTAIRYARVQRTNWIAHRRTWSTDLPVHEDGFAAAEVLVLKAARAAEQRALIRGEQPYGQTMLEELEKELAESPVSIPGNLTPDIDLLLGCAYDLTNECRIWWSAEFEIDEDR